LFCQISHLPWNHHDWYLKQGNGFLSLSPAKTRLSVDRERVRDACFFLVHPYPLPRCWILWCEGSIIVKSGAVLLWNIAKLKILWYYLMNRVESQPGKEHSF